MSSVGSDSLFALFSSFFVLEHFSYVMPLGLRALIRLCTDLGLKEASDYAAELRKMEHAQTDQENRRTSTGTNDERIVQLV